MSWSWVVLQRKSMEGYFSCLNPIFFNLYTAKLHEIQDEKTHIFPYADNFLIVLTTSSFLC